MGCTVAREFWRKVKTLTGAKLPTLHPATWATDMLSSKVCTDKERGIFIIGMYALWMQRNQRRHGEQGTPISIAVKWAIDTAYDLWNLHKPIPPAQPKAVHRWQPPPEGWFKCNTDGAFDARKGEGASGVALRTASGVFAGGRARWYPHGRDALTMEALACRDGVLLAKGRGVEKLILETDSQVFLKLWKEDINLRSEIAPIISEIRLISSCFNSFLVVSVNRSCNQVAHTLAKQVSSESRMGEWQQAPTYIAHLLAEDCNPG
jgi:ribonuclease HI